MKLSLHRLKTSWLLLAMAIGVGVGELAAWYITRLFELRFPPVPVAALCVGLVAAVVALIYDGTE